MTEQKTYKYFVSYFYGILDSYTTGYGNRVIETNSATIKNEDDIDIIKNLIILNYETENENTQINPIILNIIPLPIKN
jgi:uncharacterized GH25 family protein